MKHTILVIIILFMVNSYGQDIESKEIDLDLLTGIWTQTNRNDDTTTYTRNDSGTEEQNHLELEILSVGYIFYRYPKLKKQPKRKRRCLNSLENISYKKSAWYLDKNNTILNVHNLNSQKLNRVNYKVVKLTPILLVLKHI